MTTPTWLELKTIIKNDLDLNEDPMITDEMLLAWANNAVDEAEQHVLGCGVGADYFLQSESLALVSGTSEYALPANILAHKIRMISYDNGSQQYEIKRIRNLKLVPNIETGSEYRYLIVTTSAGAARLKLYPASAEDSASNVTVWFIGNANALVDDSSTVNIPEATNFIISYIKLECLRREGHPNQGVQEQERERQRALLIETLADMVPDEDNEIQIDTSFYDEMN